MRTNIPHQNPSSKSSPQRAIRNPFEIIDHTRGSEGRVVMEELSVKASYGLNQRIVASYNADMGGFDASVFLGYPAQPVPKPDQAMKYLSHAKAGMLNPQDLIRQLPFIPQTDFEKNILKTVQNKGFLYGRELAAINYALGREANTQINPDTLKLFYETYGGSEGNIFKLIATLQHFRVPEDIILNLSVLLHGSLRTNTAVGFSNINATVRKDPKSWKNDVIWFCAKPLRPSDTELQGILNARKVMGFRGTTVQDDSVSINPKTKQEPKVRNAPSPEKPKGQSRIAGGTDKGRVRETNEDSFWQNGSAFIVADGMGGHAKGEVASNIAVGAFSEQIKAGNREVKRILKDANSRVYYAAKEPEHAGMGTTVVAGVLEGNVLTIGNVGDSRAYLIPRNDKIRQITHDHSWVQERVDEGVLTEDQAENHPFKNKITRALGRDPGIEVDIFQKTLNHGDSFVACSDGLSNVVKASEIEQVVRKYDPQVAVNQLIELANQRGGPDNITVIVGRI